MEGPGEADVEFHYSNNRLVEQYLFFPHVLFDDKAVCVPDYVKKSIKITLKCFFNFS